MEANKFDAAASIKTIEEALSQAKSEKTTAYYYYIVWGTVLFLHYLVLYVSLRFPELDGVFLQYANWLVFPIGGAISFWKMRKDEQTERMQSHFEKVYQYAFIGFAMMYGTFTMASILTQTKLLTVYYPMLIGVTVFVVGGITGHRPSILCGVLGIVLTNLSVMLPMEFQLVFAALASVVSCVLPGYLMKNSNV